METEERFKYYRDSFIAHWVSDELTTDERREFEQWLQAHPQEKKYFDELRTIWEESGKLYAPIGLSEADRWRRVAEKLEIQPKVSHIPYFKSIYGKVTAAAAIVVIMISTSWLLFRNQDILVSAPKGMHKVANLPCGSKVTLNAASSIRYGPGDWQEKREIVLDGEAYFEVTPGAPLLVTSGFVDATVLGTSFNVKARGNQVEVACVSGRVAVTSHQMEESTVILNRGFATSVSPNSVPAQPFQFNIQQKIAWISGEFYFQSTPLREVLQELERQFNVTIVTEEKIAEFHFTGRIRNTDLSKALELISLSSALKYRIQQDSTVMLY